MLCKLPAMLCKLCKLHAPCLSVYVRLKQTHAEIYISKPLMTEGLSQWIFFIKKCFHYVSLGSVDIFTFYHVCVCFVVVIWV